MGAMIMHKFGMRADCCSYSTSGMGCSAGIVAAELAANLLQVLLKQKTCQMLPGALAS
jgi:predicted naringenin-chalcone synthase